MRGDVIHLGAMYFAGGNEYETITACGLFTYDEPGFEYVTKQHVDRVTCKKCLKKIQHNEATKI